MKDETPLMDISMALYVKDKSKIVIELTGFNNEEITQEYAEFLVENLPDLLTQTLLDDDNDNDQPGKYLH